MAASNIIQKFGGVAALAGKLSEHTGQRVPLTTVSYWSKIDRIPSDRMQDVLDTAKHFEIDVVPEDFFSGAA